MNELDAIKGNLKVEVAADDGRMVFTRTMQATMTSGVTQLFSEKFDTTSLEGTYIVKVQITANGGSPVAGNLYSFDVFSAEQLAIPKNRIAVLDPGNSLKPFLSDQGISFVEFDATFILPAVFPRLVTFPFQVIPSNGPPFLTGFHC